MGFMYLSSIHHIVVWGRLDERLSVVSIRGYNPSGVLFSIGVLMWGVIGVIWWGSGVFWGCRDSPVNITGFFRIFSTLAVSAKRNNLISRTLCVTYKSQHFLPFSNLGFPLGHILENYSLRQELG